MTASKTSPGQMSLELTASSEGSRVPTSRLPENARAWLESDQASGSSFIEFCESTGLSGASLRTSPAYCPPMEGETLRFCLEDLPESYRAFLSGAGEPAAAPRDGSTPSPGGCWTLNTLEFHSGAVESSLSDILVPGEEIPPRYFLSRKACRGILSRAGRRGRTLPTSLLAALEAVAGSEDGHRTSSE
jgi:hypothetical protein